MPMLARARTLLSARARHANSRSTVITDDQFTRALGLYVGMVDRVLDDPSRWLGTDTDAPSGSLPAKTLHALRRRAFGAVHPGSPTWSDQPIQARTAWWLRRISVTAGTAAAAPRFAGLAADRLPLQAALGASAAGLAVCATARENGLTEPAQWVPLLGQVLFDRRLGSPAAPDPALAERALTDAVDDPSEPPSALERLGDGGRRAARTFWRLALALLEVQDALDHRPRGGRLPRLVGKVPVLGAGAGWLDERGGIRRAAKQTQHLLDAPTTRGRTTTKGR